MIILIAFHQDAPTIGQPQAKATPMFVIRCINGNDMRMIMKRVTYYQY